MDTNDIEGKVEPVTVSDLLNLATWDRTRSDDELRDFISRRTTMIGL